MPRDLVRTGSFVLAILGVTTLSAGQAVAQQQQAPIAEPQQQQQQEKAQQTPSGQMGKEEPSSHAPSAKPADNSVFVNGALAVPGAPENTDTVPAKFSEQNAADDKLSIAAYTFKLLTEEQRRAIYTALKGQPAGPAFNADIGAELDQAFCLQRLLQLWTRGTRGVSAEFTETRRCPRGLHMYCSPVLRHPAGLIQAANFRSAIAF